MQKTYLTMGALLLGTFIMSSVHADWKSKLKQKLQEGRENAQNRDSDNWNERDEWGRPKKRAAPQKPAPVCDASASIGVCYHFSGPKQDAKTNEFACRLMRGKYIPTSTCPEDRVIGRCTVLPGKPDEYVLRYYSGGKFTPVSASRDCRDSKSSIHAQGAGDWSEN